MNIETLISECVQRNASDIHIKEGERIMFRIEGQLSLGDDSVIPSKLMMFDLLYDFVYGKKERISDFKHTMELDFGYIHTDGTSYRGNAFMHMGRIGIAIRRILEKISNLIDLGIPTSIGKVLQAKQGLFLVTGPTGSGKSTTLASMIEAINEVRTEHIITIEDPVEYIFQSKKSIISQREIGRDTASFKNAIRAVMREDANIIVIGEIRDAETMDTVLSLAETGHLVFSTLHTSGSVQTINRIIQFFPSEAEPQTRTRLSNVLIGSMAQRLIPRKDGNGRIAIREIMFTNPAIRNIISKGELNQLPNTIEMGQEDGMIGMKHYAALLREKGLVEEKAYRGYFTNETL